MNMKNETPRVEYTQEERRSVLIGGRDACFKGSVLIGGKESMERVEKCDKG